MVGKYTDLSDAYLSVIKALQHACLAANRRLQIDWVEASHLEEGTKAEDAAAHTGEVPCGSVGLWVGCGELGAGSGGSWGCSAWGTCEGARRGPQAAPQLQLEQLARSAR